MAVKTVPANCYEQPDDTEIATTVRADEFAVNVKGNFLVLRTWIRGMALGVDTFDGHLIKGRSIRRVAGDLAIATLSLGNADSTGEGGQIGHKGVWSFHSARNDRSILSKCTSPQQRIHLEMWQKETDGKLADAFKYKDDDGTVHELTEQEQAIAQKIGSGIDTIVRFYPILTYTCYYKTCPKNWGVDIGYIRTPAAAAADRVIAPDNINAVISGFEWLKMQDDVDEQPDDTFKRTQSWWGARTDEGGWDHDLYGS